MSEITNLPEISFVDGVSLDTLRQNMINDYQNKYEETTGESITLYPGDSMRILINSFALQLYQCYQYINNAGKQNLLKYSSGAYLDNLGAFRGVTRLSADPAGVTVRFTLSSPQTTVVSIPKGTRVSGGDEVYFATDDYSEILPGIMYKDVSCTCLTKGSVGNAYEVGQINVLVDPITYVASVSNITASSGGSDVEDDASFRERIFIAPSSYSVAGPREAYIYHMKSFSTLISDVKVQMTAPGYVDVRVLLEGGEIPDTSFLTEAEKFLSDSAIRPLTDHVTVQAPDVVNYTLEVTYYILQENSNAVETIKAAVESAINNYMTWQKAKIGRDINPSKLTNLIIAAGAKRVVITAPIYTSTSSTAVAICTNTTISYGGLEDD